MPDVAGQAGLDCADTARPRPSLASPRTAAGREQTTMPAAPTSATCRGQDLLGDRDVPADA
ncbi:hypothetical protein [Streptomyces sp. NPDC003006]